MSNGFRWEMSRWGDNTVRLAFWDSLSGDDKVIILNADGTADEILLDGTGGAIEKAHTRKVNLAEYLYAWFEANEK